MNVAFKHLEAKLRFGELTVGQWAAILGGVLFALVFAQYLSPVRRARRRSMLGVYLGAIPASAAFFASLSEFDLWGLLAAALRWRRSPGRYVPGGGETARGYVLLADGARRDAAARETAGARPRTRCGTDDHVRARRSSDGTTGTTAGELAEAGELLAVEAIDRSGLVVTSEGAFVRVLRVTPPNPLILADEDRRAVAGGLRPSDRAAAGRAVAAVLRRRAPGPARGRCSPTPDARSRPPPGRRRRATSAARDLTALSRWRLYAAMEESLRRHADEQAAVELRAYVVVPLPAARARRRTPRWPACDAAGCAARRADARRAGAPAGGAREPGARRRAARRARGARAARSASSTARRCCGCCGRASTRPAPTATGGAPRAHGRGARRARRRARPRAGARGPRWRCASGSPRSSVDFTRDAPRASRSTATSSR